MSEHKHEVFSVDRARRLDNRFRRLLENPNRILRNHVREGMTVLDFGCGPGYFTLELARLVGGSGKVLAVDLQQEMLDMIRKKIKGPDLEKRIQTQKCSEDKIGVIEELDFALVYYVLHETPNPENTLKEIYNKLKPGATLYIAEPKSEVSKQEFAETIKKAEAIGFKTTGKPWKLITHTAILKK
jgi:ubiquinone/menaquinone biosynthesis C-methylase UbiE